MRTRLTLGIVAGALIAVLLFVGGPVAAKKPPKPPPEPPPQVDTGTVYYKDSGVVSSMNPDGSGSTSLLTIDAYYPCEPSAATYYCSTHGKAERWFLQLRSYDSDPNDQVMEEYPNGYTRHELYAVCEGGTAVRLTDDADLEPSSLDGSEWYRAQPRWAKDGSVVDGKVSILAQKWAKDASGDWFIQAWGLHVLTLDPSNLSSHSAGSPSRIPVTFDRAGVDGTRVYSKGYDWSPDGKAFVYRRRGDDQGLWRADLDGTWSTTQLLTDHVIDPRWSPKASRIAFLTLDGDIDTMDPYDTTDRTTVIEKPSSSRKWSKSLALPFWSPNGTHLVYHRRELRASPLTVNDDVYRATASGGDQTELGSGTPLGWR